MKSIFRTALLLTLTFMILTGIAYPLALTGVAQMIFPTTANGSVVEVNGQLVGSRLIGQTFVSDRYFNGRPSAAGKDGYDATSSSGSNLAPSSKTLIDTIKERASALGGGLVPADLVTASASGLDPDISPAAAFWQVERVAKARNIPTEKLKGLIEAHIESPKFGFLGEPRVNVLELNMALDRMTSAP